MESQGDLGNLETLLASIDLDGDGSVDHKEFVAACIEEQTLYNQDNLEKARRHLGCASPRL
jgi:hypothetical protein